MIDLHLVSWNRPKMTELTIRTIHRNTTPGTFRLQVLDNGSGKATKQVLQELYKEDLITTIIDCSKNEGLEWARQELFTKETYGEYFIDVDNDCLPEPRKDGQDWVERLIDLMERYEEYSAISCRTQVMIGTGNIFEDESKDITDFPHPGGSLRIMRASSVRFVGGWDRDTPGRGAEERYIGSKLNAEHYKTGFATHINTLHLFGTRAEDLTDRWGYDKHYKPEDSGHSDIWHPALQNGDDFNEVVRYSGEELAKEYFGDNRHSQKE